VTSRSSTRFSADGSLAACLASDEGGAHAEVWDFTATAPRPQLLPTADGENVLTQLVPLARRAALLVRHRGDGHDLVRLANGPTGTVEQRLCTVGSSGFRLVATPGATALALTWDSPEQTTVWRVLDREPWLERVAEHAGMLLGGVPLDRRHMAFTRHADGAGAVRLDLADGAVAPLLPGMRGTTHALLADPYSGLVVLAAQDGNGLRLAYHHRQTGRTTFPTALSAIEGAVLPLAVAPGGRCVALQVRRGARTHLLRHRVADDRLTEVDFPAGIIGGVGAWSATGLRFPYSSPVCPSAIATVGTSWHLAGLDAGPERVPAHLEWFPGRTGDTEAVVYGDWRTAERVVVALHGGPEAAWDMGYQPMLQRLAATGCAVVAPNQRGSTGYGAEHAAAIHDDWGGPDRIDVCRVGRVLTRGRPTAAQKPLLFGESYGAYLALLTAGHRPDLWSGCAAISPFLSGRRLRAEATPTVRALVDRLGGCGGGDVMPVVRRIEGALLVVHGDADATVPVTQSRALRDHFRRPGRARFEYVEVPGAGHDPIASSAAAQDALARFLSD
jgi:pimeloyl-ACP methyl ester carboxylesterase